MKIYKLTNVATVFSVLSVLAVSCSQKNASLGVTSTYIKAVYSTPLTFDPSQMDDTASLVASNLLYDGLLSFSPNLELQGAVAKTWSTSADGKTLTFNLNEGLKFHDGAPITSLDVVHSLQRVVSAKSKVYSYYDCIEGAAEYHHGKAKIVKGLRATKTDQIKIDLRYPFPPFLSVLAGATAKILPRNADDLGFFKNPIGSGPFQFLEIKKNDHSTDVVFEKAKNYGGVAAKLDHLVLREMSEVEALQLAGSGAIHDLANFPLSGEEEVFKSGKHVLAPVAATWIIGLNARLAPFKDLKVRKAFVASADTEGFRKRFHPDAIPAVGYIPPGLPGHTENLAFRPVGSKESKRSKTLVEIAIPEVLARSAEMKAYLENSFRLQGWNVRVKPMKWADLMKGYSEKTLQAFLVSMNMDYADTEFLVRNFESSNPDNFSGLTDLAIDQSIRKARSTQDRVMRQNMYVELVKMLNQKAITINLFHPRGHYWVSDCVDGFEPNILADVYIDYRNVSIKTNCKGVAKL